MSAPRLSICIATLNRGAFIGETLESIVSQAANEVEIVVVDGASTDNTEDIVRSYAARFPRLRYLRLENKGGVADGEIFNIGNPKNDASIRTIAEKLRKLYAEHPLRKNKKIPPIKDVDEKTYYGKGYQDIQHRRPSIRKAEKLLGWKPKVDLDTSLKKTLDYFLKENN